MELEEQKEFIEIVTNKLMKALSKLLTNAINEDADFKNYIKTTNILIDILELPYK